MPDAIILPPDTLKRLGYQTELALAKCDLFPAASAVPAVFRGKRYFLARDCEVWLSRAEWLHAQHRVPLPGVVPTGAPGPDMFRLDHTERALSRKAWGEEGRVVLDGATPVGHLSFKRYGGGWYDYDVFTLSQTRPKRPAPVRSPAKVLDDLLGAIFKVNRAAKRWRDSASGHYVGQRHGFAGYSRRRKENLYRLKDAGIREAIARGLLTFERTHGRLGVWVGGGFRFHAPFAPATASETVDAQDFHWSDAKPAGHREPRLVDAVATLEFIAPPTLSTLGLVELHSPALRGGSRDATDDEDDEDEDDWDGYR